MERIADMNLERKKISVKANKSPTGSDVDLGLPKNVKGMLTYV